MAQGKKISELTEVSSVTDNDEFLFVDKEGSGSDSGVGGKTAKIKFSNLKASFGNLGEQGEKGERGDNGPRGLDGEGTQYWTQSPSDGDAIYYPTAKIAVGTDDLSALGTNGMYLKGVVHSLLQIDGPTGNSMIGLGTPGDNTGSITIKHVRDGNILRISSPNASNQGGGLTLVGNQVGIGTDSPLASLHLKRAGSNSSSMIRMENADASDSSAKHWYFSHDDTAGTGNAGFNIGHYDGSEVGGYHNDIHISQTGNVGIGITNPAEKFVVHGGHETNDLVYTSFDTAGANPQFGFHKAGMGRASSLVFKDTLDLNDDFVRYSIRHGNFATTSYEDSDVLSIRNATDSIMTFTQNGNVGIGTDTPTRALTINHVHPGIRFEDADGDPAHVTQVASYEGTLYFDSDMANPVDSAGRTSGKGFVFRTDANTSETPNGKELLVINQNGNVGIGNATPNEKLRVTAGSNLRIMGFEAPLNGSTNQLIARLMGETNGSNYADSKISFDVVSRDGTTYNPALTLASGGNVGIGTDDPSEKLDVQGNINVNGGMIKANYAISNDSGLAKALGHSLYHIMISSNYNSGESVRSAAWYVTLNNEATSIADVSQVHVHNNQTAEFYIQDGILKVRGLSSGNNRVIVMAS
jgi:hypothetical protein